MSIKIMSAIFETEFRDLPLPDEGPDGKPRMAKASTLKLLLLAIADHANDEGEAAYPSISRLERKTALSRQGVLDTQAACYHNGLLSMTQRASKLGTNDYLLNLESFPILSDKGDRRLLVKPLDQSSHLTSASQVALPPLVKPLDLNHPITTQEPPEDASAQFQEEERRKKLLPDLSVENQIFLGVKNVKPSPSALVKEALQSHFKLTPNWETKTNRQWIEWAVQQKITPEQIEHASKIWRDDKRFNWSAPSLKYIHEHWLELIEEFKAAEPEIRQPPINSLAGTQPAPAEIQNRMKARTK